MNSSPSRSIQRSSSAATSNRNRRQTAHAIWPSGNRAVCAKSVLITTPDNGANLLSCRSTTCALDPSVFNPINGVNVYPEQADLVAVAPEPSSFVLLGTGALSVAGAVRRRFLNA